MDRKDSNREVSALGRSERRDVEGTMSRTHATQAFKDLNCRYLIVRKTRYALHFHGPSLKYDGKRTKSALVHTYANRLGAVKHCLLPVRYGPDFYEPDWTPYWVENEHMYIGYSSLDVATHFSRLIYIKGQYINPSFMRREIESYFTEETKLVTDAKYMEAAGIPAVKQEVTVPVKELQHFEQTKVQPEIYALFKNTMDELLRVRKPYDTFMRRMGDTKAVSKVSSPVNAAVHLVENKRDYTPRQWLEMSNGKAPTIAYQFPKPGNLKSDGSARIVVSLDPFLEAWNRKFWNGVDYTRLEGYCRKPSEMRSDLKHSYDIKSADLYIGPYFRKYCEERYPKVEDALMPLVVGKYGPYRTQALPSGVPHTAIVTNAFTYSVCKHLGQDYQFQGDGFLTSKEVNFDFLRKSSDYTLNGFRVVGGRACYTNTDKIGELQYLRPHKVNGELRYRVRYSCLSMLGAIGLDRYPMPRRGLLTADQIRRMLDPASLSRLEALAVGYNFNYSSANCESTVRDETQVCHRLDCTGFEVDTC